MPPLEEIVFQIIVKKTVKIFFKTSLRRLLLNGLEFEKNKTNLYWHYNSSSSFSFIQRVRYRPQKALKH